MDTHFDRAKSLVEKLCTAVDFDSQGPSKEAVTAAVRAFADEGFLDASFLEVGDPGAKTLEIRLAADVAEVLAGHSVALAAIFMINAVVVPTLIALNATREQKDTWLPRVRRGELQFAFAMTEPEAGSDAASLRTTGIPDGNDFVLSGEKIYSSGAATADYLIVVARTEVREGTKRSFSLFLVSPEAEGVSVEPLQGLAGNAFASCRVRLNRVKVVPTMVLGEQDRLGEAWASLRLTGSLERVLVAAIAVGLAGKVVERAKDFALSRHQFGHSIATFQSIQHRLVDMHTTHVAMRLLLDRAVTALERGGETEEACTAKYFCAEQLQQIVAQGMRVVGGRGYFSFEKMARLYREAPFCLYAGGTVEIQKMLIARSMGLMG